MQVGCRKPRNARSPTRARGSECGGEPDAGFPVTDSSGRELRTLMRLSGPRFTMAITALMVGAGSVVFAIGGSDHLVAGAATSSSGGVSAGPSQIVVQT